MTKAMTKGAKLRRKAGRPRNVEPAREPNGRARRSPPSARARESYVSVAEHTLRARCRRMGWRATEDAMLAARDSRLGTMIGCLHVAGLVSERAYSGIMTYADTRARWLRSIDSPREWPAIGSYGEPVFGGIGAEIDGEAAKRAADAFLKAEGALIASGGKAAVWAALTVSEEMRVADYSSEACATLKRAGLALARHFGL